MEEAILGLVTTVLGVIALFVKQWIAANVKPRQLQTVLDIARTAVAGAEKIGDAFGVDGKAKYEFVQSVLKTSAKKVGINLTDSEAMAFIHAVLAEVDGLDEITDYPFPPVNTGQATAVKFPTD